MRVAAEACPTLAEAPLFAPEMVVVVGGTEKFNIEFKIFL